MDIAAINRVENRERTAIIVVGYNRLGPLKRLLNSLLSATYKFDNVPLIISIDASGNQELYDAVNSFQWPYGDLYVNIQKERLGLKRHIFSCFEMSQYFRAVIVFEDDLFVAPDFYNYTEAALSAYEHDDCVCGIALYSMPRNGYVGLPFTPMQSGSDVYLHQDVCTSGECLTYSMWSGFRAWLVDNENRSYEEIEMPANIKRWMRAWSKYYYAYMIETHKSFITPYISYTTNCGEAGEHGGKTNVAQVPLQWGVREHFVMPPSSELTSYDAYSNNVALYAALGLNPEEVTLDLYGINDMYLSRRYLLTVRNIPCKVVKEYDLSFYPIEVNVLQGVEGNGIKLYDTTIKASKDPSINSIFAYLSYYLGATNPYAVLKYISIYCWKSLCRKLKIRF
ncbi:MAG: glycosyltransferase [Alistipes sp.]|nr:glycosyltransferase [Alistipes sp.]